MTDFHIIGGGVIGMMTAKELVDAGATVTILDRKSFAQESSWAGGEFYRRSIPGDTLSRSTS